jgi:hypothetical protein
LIFQDAGGPVTRARKIRKTKKPKSKPTKVTPAVEEPSDIIVAETPLPSPEN